MTQPAPARRRIAPIPVFEPPAGTSLAQPSPHSGPKSPDRSTVSQLGPGRRLFHDLLENNTFNFKELLKKAAALNKEANPGAPLLPPILTSPSKAPVKGGGFADVIKRLESAYTGAGDDDSDSDSDMEAGDYSSGDSAEGSEGGDGSGDEGSGSENSGSENSSGGEEGNEAGKEGKKNAPSRAKGQNYEEDFIDDEAMLSMKESAKAKTKFSGFYVNAGRVETVVNPGAALPQQKTTQPPQKRARPSAPKPPKSGETAAEGGAPSKVATASSNATGTTGAAVTAVGAAAGGSGAAAPKAKLKRKPAEGEKGEAKIKGQPAAKKVKVSAPTPLQAGASTNEAPGEKASTTATTAAVPVAEDTLSIAALAAMAGRKVVKDKVPVVEVQGSLPAKATSSAAPTTTPIKGTSVPDDSPPSASKATPGKAAKCEVLELVKQLKEKVKTAGTAATASTADETGSGTASASTAAAGPLTLTQVKHRLCKLAFVLHKQHGSLPEAEVDEKVADLGPVLISYLQPGEVRAYMMSTVADAITGSEKLKSELKVAMEAGTQLITSTKGASADETLSEDFNVTTMNPALQTKLDKLASFQKSLNRAGFEHTLSVEIAGWDKAKCVDVATLQKYMEKGNKRVRASSKKSALAGEGGSGKPPAGDKAKGSSEEGGAKDGKDGKDKKPAGAKPPKKPKTEGEKAGVKKEGGEKAAAKKQKIAAKLAAAGTATAPVAAVAPSGKETAPTGPPTTEGEKGKPTEPKQDAPANAPTAGPSTAAPTVTAVAPEAPSTTAAVAAAAPPPASVHPPPSLIAPPSRSVTTAAPSAPAAKPTPAAPAVVPAQAKAPAATAAAGQLAPAPAGAPGGGVSTSQPSQKPAAIAPEASEPTSPPPPGGSQGAVSSSQGGTSADAITVEEDMKQRTEAVAAAVKQGASAEKVEAHLKKVSSSSVKVAAIKALCHGGPQGLSIRDLVNMICEKRYLNWDLNIQSQRNSRSSHLHQVINVSSSKQIIGHIGNHRYALLCFPGVVAMPKPSDTRPKIEVTLDLTTGSSMGSPPGLPIIIIESPPVSTRPAAAPAPAAPAAVAGASKPAVLAATSVVPKPAAATGAGTTKPAATAAAAGISRPTVTELHKASTPNKARSAPPMNAYVQKLKSMNLLPKGGK